MRNRGVLMLGLAVLLGFASIFLIRQWLAHYAAAVAEPSTTRSVVVARVGVSFGDRIVPTSLREINWPIDSLPEGTFTSVAELTAPGEDRVVLRSMEPGEPVLSNKVSGQRGRAALSVVIDKSMRAITIKVNEVYG